MHCITLHYVPQIHHYFLNQFLEICIYILSRNKLLSSSIIIIIKVEGLTWQLMKACSVNLQNKSNEIKKKEHQIHDYRMESGNQWRSPTKRPKQAYNFINHPKPEKRAKSWWKYETTQTQEVFNSQFWQAVPLIHKRKGTGKSNAVKKHL